MPTPPDLAVVLATYNREKPLNRVLESLRMQTSHRSHWEVWVAVDGSTDGTMELLERWRRRNEIPLHFLWQENAGQSAARDAAIRRTEAAHIIIIDDDMELGPDFVNQHGQAAAVAPLTTVVIGKVISAKNWQRKPLYSAVAEQGMLSLHKKLDAGQEPTATAFVTQNVSFPRQMYLDAGGFDVALRLDEDRELGLRLERRGARFVFAKLAWAIHHSDVGAYAKWEKRQYEYGNYAYQVWEKHDRDSFVHPLRNHVTGSALNRTIVKITCASDERAQKTCDLLRIVGIALQKVALYEAAFATHKAIRTIQYHLGVKHTLGSWDKFLELEAGFVQAQGRPTTPTGVGATMKH